MKLLQYLGRGGKLYVKRGNKLVAPKVRRNSADVTYGHHLLWNLDTCPPDLISHVMGGWVIDAGAVPPARTMQHQGKLYFWEEELNKDGKPVLRPTLIKGIEAEE